MNDPVLMYPFSKSELQETIKIAVAEVLQNDRKKEKDLINADQLIDWLGISLSTLNVWKRDNKIPYKRLGKRIFFSRSEVLEALKESNYQRLKELKL